ncbi:MAG: histidine phosphatase family protein [Gallionella sp.]|nr:histidine phosphatase family protein [Gallionella sp.]MDD4947147.1 histidine phosphatase family protein [Gallionella sp.]MDD5612696.1 histidine phosphatase family protein [Gallionella sp.]
MDLILWRHAEAEEGTDDLARNLTAKGRQQAESAAAFLRRHLPAETRILVSPAVRTKQTASALTERYTLTPAIAPDASVHAVLKSVRWPDAEGTVLVVGHQPTLGAVAASILGSGHESLRIKKGALWWLSRRPGSTEPTVKLIISPEFF